MKVYVVTSGEYSDYGIEAVFLDKVLADAYVESYNTDRRYDSGRIEEYEADSVDMRGKKCWRVWMDLDGNVQECNPHNHNMEDSSVFYTTGGYIGGDGNTWRDGHFLASNVISDTAERAIKVMNERRTAWILERGAEVGR